MEYSLPVILRPTKATVHLVSGKKIMEVAEPGKYEDDNKGAYLAYEIEDIERAYPGIGDMLKRGDIFEDIDTSGYRSQGVFFFDRQKTIIQGDEYDPYGYPPDEFKLIIEFPPGYWDTDGLIINDTFEKYPRAEAETSGTIVSSPSFYWHLELAPSFLYLEELGVPKDVDVAEVSFTYPQVIGGELIERTFKTKYFILDYRGHRYLIDAEIAEYAEEFEEETRKLTGHYGNWASCWANHNVEKDKVFLEKLREAVGDPTIDYVLVAP